MCMPPTRDRASSFAVELHKGDVRIVTASEPRVAASNGERARSWTHPSVLALAGTSDPVSVVTHAARSLAYNALEHGWDGPPFDPLDLALITGIDVFPNEDVSDAQLETSGSRSVINYNPNRSRGRVRFSIAHELAHTLFPDYRARTRHRAPSFEPDGWQLELLCNLAAAELLMPSEAFPQLVGGAISIDRIVDLHRQFEVSVETAAIRAAHGSETFVAFTAASHGDGGQYSVDYAVGADAMRPARWRGTKLPADSVVAQCVAVGVTAKGRELWSADPRERTVECIGVPPYPGERLPRVVGIRIGGRRGLASLPRLRYLRGDGTQPRGGGQKIVAQVVNDRAALWGGGFASAVRRRWPAVQASFRSWADAGNLKLGNVHIAQADEETEVFSIVAQHGYGPSATPRIRYEALERGVAELGHTAKERGATVHLPLIGAGQAGGKWSVISQLLTANLADKGVDVTVYVPTGPDPLPLEAADSAAALLEPDE